MKKSFLIFAILILFFCLSSDKVFASTQIGTIDDTFKYAFGDKSGWINFNPDNGGVLVKDDGLSGYIWNQNYGWINLNPSTSGVKNNSEGTLSGSAWGQNTGWINFSGVVINSSGKFTGTASGDITGTVNFDCSECTVVTDWRPLSTRSSGSGGGGGGSASAGSGGSAATIYMSLSPITSNGKPQPSLGISNTVVVGSVVEFGIYTSGFINPFYSLSDSFIPSSPPPTSTAPPTQFQTSYIFPRYLGFGDNGPDVLKLQQILLQLGFFPASITPNGHYGPATTQAVKDFQLAHNIRQTGNVGPLTLAALNQLSILSTPLNTPVVTPAIAPAVTSITNANINSTGIFSWIPIQSDAGVHNITVSATDSFSHTANEVVHIIVIPQVLFTPPPSPLLPPPPSTPTSYVFTRYLGFGDNGPDVLKLQQILLQLGFFPASITPNGHYGPVTVQSVQAFQLAHNIRQTGNVGPLTKDALNQLH